MRTRKPLASCTCHFSFRLPLPFFHAIIFRMFRFIILYLFRARDFPSHGICLDHLLSMTDQIRHRTRHSDSPPLSPIDTRSPSYFPPTHRDYALNAVGSGAGPSSPTTPSSVSDSPSTPFSPHYASSPYGGSTHGHSHSHSSSASASGYIQGTPLPPLQLNTGHAGGHFVPPTGNDYPIPASPYSPSHHG